MLSTINTQQIILVLAVNTLVSGGITLWLYFTRGADAALAAGFSIFLVLSPICLALASPLTFYFAKKKLEDLGAKLNNPEALKTLSNVNVVALPFNRVLTCNDYYVTDLVPVGMSQTSLLEMAASVERESDSILGRTICDAAEHRRANLSRSSNFKDFPGRGVEATVNRTLTRVGNVNWIEENSIAVSANFRTKIDQFLVKGKTPLLVATGRVARGIVALKDEFSDDAKKFLARLNKLQIQSLLLTAHPKKMEHCIRKEEFLLDHIRTNLTPEGKAREVQIFRAKGNIVAVIGNDENDLPALKAADVSFLLKGGTMHKLQAKVTPFDFEIPKLRTFLSIRETALLAANVLNVNYIIAVLSWVLLVPLAILSAIGLLPINFHPLAAVAGVVLFGVMILLNSLRTN